ncbi:uncharacterized protein LOC131831786 [Mustela lutreola]|uniref:uncharacterized protein LOC131831786 n=1 Tax=Mustela lutreola TaxID=9666 RepID=UPI002796F921|nr:uncharacterized protein LOC131831786 [Mustela lutreola]
MVQPHPRRLYLLRGVNRGLVQSPPQRCPAERRSRSSGGGGWGRGGGRESVAETNFKNGCKESSRGQYSWRREEERKTETGKRLRPRAMARRSRRKSGPRSRGKGEARVGGDGSLEGSRRGAAEPKRGTEGARVGFTRVAPALEFLTLYYTAHVVSILLKAGIRGRTSPQFSLTRKCVHEATQMFHCSVHFCYDYKSTTLVWRLQVNFRN